MPAITGNDYIKRIDRLQTNVWIDGNLVTGNISEHPAFKGVMKSQAKRFFLTGCRCSRNTVSNAVPLSKVLLSAIM